jgi:hypothetical protein
VVPELSLSIFRKPYLIQPKPDPHPYCPRTVAQTVDLLSPENEYECGPAKPAGVSRYRTSDRHTLTIVRAVGIQTSSHSSILLRTGQLIHLVCYNRFVRFRIRRGRSDQRSCVGVRIIACSCSEHGILCGEVHCKVEGPHPWTNRDPCHCVGPDIGIRSCVVAKCACACPFNPHPRPIAENFVVVPSSARIQKPYLLDFSASPSCCLYSRHSSLSGMLCSNYKPFLLRRL